MYRAMIDASPLAIYVLGRDGAIRVWNRAAQSMFGWSAAEVVGRSDPTVPEAGRSAAACMLRDAWSEAPVVDREVIRLSKRGEVRELSLSAARLDDSHGGEPGVMVILADISVRRRIQADRDELLERERTARADAEAAEHRARFLAAGSALLDGSLNYVSTLGNLARFVVPALADYCLIDEVQDDLVSRVAMAHADPSREVLLDRENRQPLAGDPERHPVVRAMLNGASVLVEEVDDDVLNAIAHDDDHRARLSEIGLHSFIVVPLAARGRPLGAMTLAYAESRRRYTPSDLKVAEELARRAAFGIEMARLYRQSRRAVRARERLLAVVSHDLRNSLATVLLNASALADAGDSAGMSELAVEQVQWIARSAEQMNRLISDLLDVSTIELGRLSVEPAPIAVCALIHEAAEMFRPLARDKGMEFVDEVPHGLPPVMVDRERFQQVIGNLVGNAIKFSAPGSTIVLRAGAHEGMVRICVSDAGPGIEAEELDSIFELYWQGQPARRGGAGLGLAIARAIVEAHGGTIWVESEPGRGSSFFFTVPFADECPDGAGA
jgi:PAS domain S-box-containing protein